MSACSFIHLSISIFSVLYNNINADYKDCTSSYSCENINSIICKDNEDCTIDCNGRYGCSHSVIYCPSNANCIIQCSNQYSCKDITINASPNTTLNITCNGPRESCRNSIINGNINTEMNIKCSNSYACYNSTIYGKYASKLHMIDCATDFWTCYMLNIYCPPNINGQKRCIFEGDDSFGGERQEPINLYAINSWNDIEFKTIKTNDYYGKMHCMYNYSETCDIAQCCGWKCANINSICQNPPTIAPSVSTMPTTYPSQTTLHNTYNSTFKTETNITYTNISVIISTEYDYNEHSAENIQHSTDYKHSENEDINHSKTLFSAYSKYTFYITIGLCMLCCIICFECWYCYYKRGKTKSKFKHIPIQQNNSDETQMICNEGNDNNINTTNGHFNLITNDSNMNELGNDMEIIGDDEYNENAIITKQATFENAENDEEIMSENYTSKECIIIKTKKNTISTTIMSEGDKHKKHTISVIGDAICTPCSYEMDESELNNNIVTISPHSYSNKKRTFS